MRNLKVNLGLLTLVFAFGSVALYVYFQPPQPDDRLLPPDEVDHSITYSNILPDDYVGPLTCKECHPTQYSRWKRHPHHNMNRLATATTVMGDFSDVKLKLPTGTARFYNDGSGRFFMSIKKDGELFRRYVVTRTVGSRYMQFYIGRQLYGPDSEGEKIYGEHMLPFSYWLKLKRWLPRLYFDADGDEVLKCGVPEVEAVNTEPDVRPYNKVCMNCHNTFAYSYKMFHGNFRGFHDGIVRASIEPLVPILAKHVDVEPTPKSFETIRMRLDPEKHLVTMGISCESCHFGGREHAINRKKIRFLPTNKYVDIWERYYNKPYTSERTNPTTIIGICTQCHCGSGNILPNGAGENNSREALDFRAGFCTSEMSCVQCHDPHTASDRPSGSPTLKKHFQVCSTCHEKFSDSKTVLAHSKHPAGSKVNCLDCHMPRYSQGLDSLVRTHRISHPVEKEMVAAGNANACNLCHLDKSMRWTLTELKKGWGTDIRPNKKWESYSFLDQPAGEYWLKHENNHLRLVATQSYERSPLGKEMLPEIIRAMNDSEPLNRVFHGTTVQRLRGLQPHDPWEVDITAPPEERLRQIEALIRKLATK